MALTIEDIDAEIAKRLSQPSSASNDMGSVSNRSLSELYQLRKEIANQETVTKNPRRGMRVTQIVLPGGIQ
jgi:hypothetical protein